MIRLSKQDYEPSDDPKGRGGSGKPIVIQGKKYWNSESSDRVYLWWFSCHCGNQIGFRVETESRWDLIAQRIVVRCDCGELISMPDHMGTIEPNGCFIPHTAEGLKCTPV